MLADNEIGNVVKELIIGNTKVKFCDDYCRDQTPEETEIILNRIADRAIGHLSETLITKKII